MTATEDRARAAMRAIAGTVAASAREAASFISSLMALARTSSAPRKMPGKPRTLFTWLG